VPACQPEQLTRQAPRIEEFVHGSIRTAPPTVVVDAHDAASYDVIKEVHEDGPDRLVPVDVDVQKGDGTRGGARECLVEPAAHEARSIGRPADGVNGLAHVMSGSRTPPGEEPPVCGGRIPIAGWRQTLKGIEAPQRSRIADRAERPVDERQRAASPCPTLHDRSGDTVLVQTVRVCRQLTQPWYRDHGVSR